MKIFYRKGIAKYTREYFTMGKFIATIVVRSYFFVLFSTKYILVHSQGNGMCNATLYKSCDTLLPGQYRCDESLEIDPETQSVVGCKETHTMEGILINY